MAGSPQTRNGLPGADRLFAQALDSNPINRQLLAWVHENLQEEISELQMGKAWLRSENERLERDKEELQAEVEVLRAREEDPAHVITDLKWHKEVVQDMREGHDITLQAREICLRENQALLMANKALREENDVLKQGLYVVVDKAATVSLRLRSMVKGLKRQ